MKLFSRLQTQVIWILEFSGPFKPLLSKQCTFSFNLEIKTAIKCDRVRFRDFGLSDSSSLTFGLSNIIVIILTPKILLKTVQYFFQQHETKFLHLFGTSVKVCDEQFRPMLFDTDVAGTLDHYLSAFSSQGDIF